MSAEVYLGCEACKAAFHIGHIVMIHSNFIADDGLTSEPARKKAFEAFVTKHTYCQPVGGPHRDLRFPQIIWEGSFDEDTWKVE
jgi:hypothetical protein